MTKRFIMTVICFLFMMLTIMAKGVCEVDCGSRIASTNKIGFEQVCQQIEAEIAKSINDKANQQYKKCGFGFEITTICGCNAPPTLGNHVFFPTSFHMGLFSFKRFMRNMLCAEPNKEKHAKIENGKVDTRELFQLKASREPLQASELIPIDKYTKLRDKTNWSA